MIAWNVNRFKYEYNSLIIRSYLYRCEIRLSVGKTRLELLNSTFCHDLDDTRCGAVNLETNVWSGATKTLKSTTWFTGSFSICDWSAQGLYVSKYTLEYVTKSITFTDVLKSM